MAKEIDIIGEIIENYRKLEDSIVSELLLKVSNHYLTTGTCREQVWGNLFRRIIPKKFAIEQGVFIVDSKKNISKEVDLAIFDEQYTPYIFNYGVIRFIPIEAVAVVVQCKSEELKNNNLTEWCESINNLQTTQGSIARMEGMIAINNARTQPATKPIKILCSLSKCNLENAFDIKIHVDKEKLNVAIDESIKTLMDAFSKFNGLKGLDDVKPTMPDLDQIKEKMKASLENYTIKNSSILSLIFQLNQLLMLINNPMLFPHQAYVAMFNEESSSS